MLTKTPSLVNAADLTGAMTRPSGDAFRIWGDVSGISGNVSGIRGDLDACEIAEEERAKGVDIRQLLA